MEILKLLQKKATECQKIQRLNDFKASLLYMSIHWLLGLTKLQRLIIRNNFNDIVGSNV